MMVISQEFPKNTLLYSKQNLKTMNNSVTNAYKFELHFTNTSLDGLKSGNIGDSSCCDDCVTKGGLDQSIPHDDGDQVVGKEGITPSPQSHNVDTSEHVQAEELGRGHPERKPVTYSEAVKDKQWRSAMDNKLEALEQNKNWTIEKLPPNKKALGCNETFAPVAKMVTVRVFLAIATAKQWELHQMDVHNAFLHGDLKEEVFRKLPPVLHKGKPGEACKLRKVQLNVLVYVDNLIVSGNDHEPITQFKTNLSNCFHMKDLENLKYFLAIEVACANEGIFLCQRKYALDIISEVGLLGAKPAKIPNGVKSSLRIGLRPDLAHSVHILSQFMQNPQIKHWEAAIRVVRYLKGSPGQGAYGSAAGNFVYDVTTHNVSNGVECINNMFKNAFSDQSPDISVTQSLANIWILPVLHAQNIDANRGVRRRHTVNHFRR
ncbi:retrovirus-related pol polyprotein from transposon RE2 [Tanacetum coccineum]|uniref:Retrovirus-related pol polyprotein from transposon RE2 n=1 Tax=Tanacetum coccineum TaxID=301880 RepID=A0ABQ5DHU3_9ASTR